MSDNEVNANFEPSKYDIFCRSLVALKDALEVNKTLLSLDFSFNTISEEGALLLMPALDRNSLTANETLRKAKFSTLLPKETFSIITRDLPLRGGKKKGKSKKKKKKKK